MKLCYVYILASIRRVLYVALTSNLEQRLWSHATVSAVVTARYNIVRLVYYEEFTQRCHRA